MKRSKTTWSAWLLTTGVGLGIAFWPAEFCELLGAETCGLTVLQGFGVDIRSLGFGFVVVSFMMLVFDREVTLMKFREFFESAIAALFAAVLSLLFLPVDTLLDLILTGFIVLLSFTACAGAAKGITDRAFEWRDKRKAKKEKANPHPIECAGPDARPLKRSEYAVAAVLVGAALIQGKRR